jgi:SpoVK/Ycf46/Vps4 family AAA+-type ATPase
MVDGTSELFEAELALPDNRLAEQAKRLIGFGRRFDRMRQDLRLLMDYEGLRKWSEKHYRRQLPLLDLLKDRYPFVIFHGDVGNGKTATAEAMCSALAKELKKEATLFKLSTRVRGSGEVGEMSTLINQAFAVVVKTAGKARLSFLIIDEGDSLASSRSTKQSHHEDKVAVNTLIQKIDGARRFDGRILIILCTNRHDTLDPAIVRRASYIEAFPRPDELERRELFSMDCEGLGIEPAVIEELVELTGPHGPHNLSYTFSDIRTRLLPEALAQAYPSRKIDHSDLIKAVSRVTPSPVMEKADGVQ